MARSTRATRDRGGAARHPRGASRSTTATTHDQRGVDEIVGAGDASRALPGALACEVPWRGAARTEGRPWQPALQRAIEAVLQRADAVALSVEVAPRVAIPTGKRLPEVAPDG